MGHTGLVTRGQTVANLVVVPVSREGKVTFAAGVSSTHVVADLVGWFAPANSTPPDLNNKPLGSAPIGPPSKARTAVSGSPRVADYLATDATPLVTSRR